MTRIRIEDNSAEFKKRLKAAIRNEMRLIGRDLVKKLRLKLPRISGTLRRAVGLKYNVKDLQLMIGYKNKGFYGGFLELGFTRRNGTQVPAKDYMTELIEQELPELQQRVLDACQRISEVR